MLPVLNLVLPIFLFVFAGFAAQKTGYMQQEKSGALIQFVMKVAIPSMLLVALNAQPISELWHYMDFFYALLAITLIMLLLSLLYAKYIARYPNMQAAFFAGNASTGNGCMLAMPILTLQMGHVGAIYGVLAVLVLVIMLQLTALLSDLSERKDSKRSAFKRFILALLNSLRQPFVVAGVLGIILALFKIPLPSPILKSLSYLGATLAPVALFAVGLDLDFSVFNKNKRAVLEISTLKLILMPILAWSFARFFDFSPQLTVAIVISSSIATAKCYYALVKQKNRYPDMAAASVVGTTAFSLITFTIILYLLHQSFPQVFIR